MAAEQITINRHSHAATLTVDGVQIPAHAIPAEDGVIVPVENDGLPRVFLELVAERVDVVNTIHSKTEESETP